MSRRSRLEDLNDAPVDPYYPYYDESDIDEMGIGEDDDVADEEPEDD